MAACPLLLKSKAKPKAKTIRMDPCDSKGYTHTHINVTYHFVVARPEDFRPILTARAWTKKESEFEWNILNPKDVSLQQTFLTELAGS